jgi:hypothetical protein
MLERTRKTAASSNIFSDDGKSKIRRTIYQAALSWLAEVQMLNFLSLIKTHMNFNASSSNLAFSIENHDDSELSQEREVYLLVFSELLTYILGIKTSRDNPVVFRLADLVSLYKQRLEQLVMKTPDVNVSPLLRAVRQE